jgi:hypothetical protein
VEDDTLVVVGVDLSPKSDDIITLPVHSDPTVVDDDTLPVVVLEDVVDLPPSPPLTSDDVMTLLERSLLPALDLDPPPPHDAADGTRGLTPIFSCRRSRKRRFSTNWRCV